MDIKAEMLELISALSWKVIHYEMHDYMSILEKKRKNLLKIDPYFNFDDFVAMIDTTISKNAKEGIAFMINGVYIANMLSPSYFINYADIVTTYSTAGFWGRFMLYLTCKSLYCGLY